MHPVKILVADDHPVIRKMVTFALQTDERFSIVGQAENGLQAVQQAKILKPHVVILNITMPVMDGFEAARRIRQHLPEVAIVILSNHTDKRFIEEARKVGAQGFVTKTEASLALIRGIEAALRGEEFFVVE